MGKPTSRDTVEADQGLWEAGLTGVETTCTSKNENSFHPKLCLHCVPAHWFFWHDFFSWLCVQYLIAWKTVQQKRRFQCFFPVKNCHFGIHIFNKTLTTLHDISSALWYWKCLDLRCFLFLQDDQTRQKLLKSFQFCGWHLVAEF